MQSSYSVTGLTCEHCENAVRAEIAALDTVQQVEVDLVPAGTSRVRVTSDGPIEQSAIVEALAEAGDYVLLEEGGHRE